MSLRSQFCLRTGGRTPTNIKYMKGKLENGKLYKITDFTVVSKGKSTPFGNNKLKITITPKTTIEPVEKQKKDFPNIPKQLPLEELRNVIDLGQTRVCSFVLAVNKPGIAQEYVVKRTDLANQSPVFS